MEQPAMKVQKCKDKHIFHQSKLTTNMHGVGIVVLIECGENQSDYLNFAC